MRTKLLLSFTLAALVPALAQAQTPEGRKFPAEQPAAGWIPWSAPVAETPADLENEAIPALPLEIIKSGDITYINGGIGDEETAQLKSQIGKYNLQIMLSAPNGAYISDVRVRIMAADGTILLDVADAGPYLYAHLPSGSYTLETSTATDAITKTKAFTIATSGAVREHIVYNQ